MTNFRLPFCVHNFIKGAVIVTSLFDAHPVVRIFLVLYVDDMKTSGNDVVGITKQKSYLCQQFKKKDLGPLTYLP